jgi:KipI family sensor histidine kinase inhibitor
MKLAPLGDAAVLVTLGERADAATLGQVEALAAALALEPLAGFVECVPANAGLTVYYDPGRVARKDGGAPYDRLARWIEERAAATAGRTPAAVERWVVIPVCYGGACGPDLEAVAAAHDLSVDEVVARHSAAEYRVSAIGFTPGFPYLAGLPESLHTARRQTPRLRVPAGSVAIGGTQTGIYPFESPGGWHLIGRTPLRLFHPQQRPPSLLQTGDRVRFRRIAAAELDAAFPP